MFRSLWAACLLAFATAVASASASESESNPITIRVQGLPPPMASGPVVDAQRRVVSAFLQAHPGISIEPFAIPQIEGSSLDAGPLMAIAAGIPPHVLYVNFRQSSTYIEQGFLAPFEVLLARALSNDPRLRRWDGHGRWLADPSQEQVARALTLIRQRTPDRAWPVVFRDDESRSRRGKHVWSIPGNTLVMALAYRKDLFTRAGLDPERPPTTWDELLEYSRALTDPQRQQYGMVFVGGPASSWSMYTFMVSNGGRAVAPGEDGRWRAVFNTAETAEALYFADRLINEPFDRNGRTIPGAAYIGSGADAQRLWSRGQVGMRFSYISNQLLLGIDPQLIGIAPVPLSHRGTRGSEINSNMLGVFASAHPAEQLAATRYIWFMTGESAQRISTTAYVNNGFGQFVNPALLEKFGYDRVLRRVPEAWKTAFDEAAAFGVPEPYGKNTQSIYLYLSRPVNRVLDRDITNLSPDEAIAAIRRELDVAAEYTNQKLLRRVPPDEMRFRRVVASIAIAVMSLAFIAGGVALWRYFTKVAVHATQGGSKLRRIVTGWALLAPALLLVGVWMYLPILGGLALAFTDYRLAVGTVFTGVDNFAAVLFDERFWYGLLRTLWFVTLGIALGFWPPIALAVMLDEVPTALLKYLFRTLFYLPAVISGVIIMFLWKQFYDPGPGGVLNRVLLSVNELGPIAATAFKLVAVLAWVSFGAMLVRLPIVLTELGAAMRVALATLAVSFWAVTVAAFALGWLTPGSLVGDFDAQPIAWINTPQLAMFCLVLPMVWAGAGPGCLLYLAALKTIPSDLYEAAEIDGASIWQKLCYITLPRLKFLITIQFIAAVIAAFKGGADFVMAMAGGGPNDATMILAVEIFLRAFLQLDFGIATAMSWLLGALLIGFTAWQLKMMSRAEFRAAGAT